MDRDWNYEPPLAELLEDAIMDPVLRSSGFDSQGLREMILKTARRVDKQDTEPEGEE